MFTIYRMRKKDEGSYALDEPKKSYGFAYTRARDQEFFAWAVSASTPPPPCPSCQTTDSRVAARPNACLLLIQWTSDICVHLKRGLIVVEQGAHCLMERRRLLLSKLVGRFLAVHSNILCKDLSLIYIHIHMCVCVCSYICIAYIYASLFSVDYLRRLYNHFELTDV